MENKDKQLSFKFEKGGSLRAKYITRQQINTITIAGKDANLTYKVSDVLNGAYTLKDGGSLSKFAKYIPLKSIVKVQLRDGKNIKPINGYWLKSTAKPIRISKFEEGGSLENKRYIVSNGKDKGVIVYAQNGDEALRKGNRSFYGAYPIKEKLTNVQLYQPNKHQFVSSLGNKKFKYVQHHFSGEGVAGNQTIYDTTIDTKLNESQLDFIGNAKVDYIKFYDSEKSKFENGGSFARGGAIKTSAKIERKVAEVNSLINEAFDSNNDPLWVYDSSSTWEEPMIYSPILYKNGKLYIEYNEPYSSKVNKEVITKSNMELDGYGTLLEIAKMYRKAIKKSKLVNSDNFKNGGSLNDLKLAWLTDLWFAVHQRETEKYDKLSKELDKSNVPYSVQNQVSNDALENRGRKNPSVSEVKSTIKNILAKDSSFANGGDLRKNITFRDWKGDIRVGYISEKLPNGYEVVTDRGVALVKQNEIID